MIGFKTKNSVYFIDSSTRRISGGKLGNNAYEFITAQIIIGTPAIITLADGRILKTGAVVKYI